jgi:CelD/BcsL family acetyltransferase involved in cellulose biosynthesis
MGAGPVAAGFGPVTVALPSSIAIEVITDRAAIAALAPDWERLRAEIGIPGPFFGPTWFAITASAISDDLRILVAHRGGRLVGVLPLMLERRRLAGLPARVLRSLSDDHSQRFDALLSPAEPDAVATMMWRHLESLGYWDALELRELLPDAAAHRIVRAAEGHLTAEWPAMRSPYLHINDATQSPKFRANLRRRKKKLEKEVGPISLERIDSHADLDHALEEGFALEAAGWKGERKSAIACDHQLRRRYSQIAHAYASRKELAIYFLRAGTRRVAFHFSLVDQGVYFLFKPGFDPALAQYGLGHLLVDEVIRDLKTRGIHELDFLGDDMPWKRDWTDRLRPHSWRYVFSRSPYGRALGAWKFRVAPTLKRLLAR